MYILIQFLTNYCYLDVSSVSKSDSDFKYTLMFENTDSSKFQKEESTRRKCVYYPYP